MEPDSAPIGASVLGLTEAEWLETAIAGGIVLGGIAVALALAVVASRIVHRFTGATESQLDDRIGRAVRRPFILLVAVGALAASLGTLSYIEDEAGWIGRTALAFMVLIVAVAVRRVLLVLVEWQAERPGGSRLHPGSLPLIRRGTTLLIFAAAVLIVLDTLGLAISPLLAGLGIGGLAVALALQPLLGNVFASSYMLSDSSIRIGDWIEVQGGPAGSVDDIGWRATRIRSFDNNIVIVPNSVLADSTVTNYSLTALESDCRVTVGVSYDADLARVDEVCRDVLGTLQEEWDTAVKGEYVPVVSFLTFGEANVDVLLKMRATTWLESLGLRHELIKRVHARFAVEGITIYPARRLLLQASDAEEFGRPRLPGGS